MSRLLAARPEGTAGWLLLAFLVLLHGALWWIELYPEPRGLNGDEVTYWQRAQGSLENEAFASLWPPFYDRFLGSLGHPILVRIVQWLLLLGTVPLMLSLGRSLGLGPRARFAAAFFLVAYPPLVAFSLYFWPEVLHLFLWLLALWCLLVRLPDAVASGGSWRPALPWSALAGLALGIALSTKSLLLLFVPVLLGSLLVLPAAIDRRARLILLLVAGTTLLVAHGPALRASHRATGSWISGGSGAFNLWVGLEDDSRRSLEGSIVWDELQRWRASGETWEARQEATWVRIRGRLAERGWLGLLREQLTKQPFRFFDHQTYLSAQLPGGALASGTRGYARVPGALAGGLRGLSAGLYGTLLIMAWAGFVLRPPWEQSRPFLRTAWWILTLFVAYHAALFLGLHIKSRYRLQMLPVLALYSAVAWDFIESRGQASRIRWVLSAAGAAGLCFLAFGGALTS